MRRYEHGGNPYSLEQSTGVPLDSVADFSANINPLGPSPKGLSAIMAALNAERGPLTRYPDPQYSQLRKRLAAYHGGVLTEAHLYPSNGGIEAIHDVFRALKPSKVMIVSPAFVEYEKAARVHSPEIVYFDLGSEANFKLDRSAFLSAVDQQKPDLVVLGSPNNPTGQLVEKAVLKETLKRLSAWGGALLTDEAFMEFLADEASSSWSMACEVPECENLFVTRSLTKFFAVPGLRAGYLITSSPAFEDYWQEVKPVWGMNALAEVYVLAAIDDTEYMEKTRAELSRLKSKLTKSLSAFKPVIMFPGEVNYLLIRVAEPFQRTLKQRLEASGILIRDCANYRGLGQGYYRLAVLGDEDQARLIKALSSLMVQNE
jgi:threonine-phosphate decarboxylase